jgi:hypothetical protein
MTQNIITFVLAGFVPLFVGFIWYNNSFGFGKAWMKENGFTEEYLQKNFNPLKTFGLCYLLGILLATALMPMTIHQGGLQSMLANVDMSDTSSETVKSYNYLMENHGNNFRTFKHGALHGLIYALFLVLPLLGINALFEKRSAKYVFLHLGYWAVTMAIVGGIVCQFLTFGK